MYYKYILPKKSIDEVREDVEKWAIQKKQEIEALQNNETYRKEFLQNLSHELKNTHICHTRLCRYLTQRRYGKTRK